jgi:hypothetical protein
MSNAIVIAMDTGRQLFALEDAETGFCAVFDYLSGPSLSAGDVVAGDVCARMMCNFEHDRGTCIAHARTGPLSRLKAVVLVDGPPTSYGPLQ